MAGRQISEETQRRIQRAIVVPGASERSVAKLLGISKSIVQRFSRPPYFTRPTQELNLVEVPEIPESELREYGKAGSQQQLVKTNRRKKAPSDGESTSPPGEPGQNGAAGT